MALLSAGMIHRATGTAQTSRMPLMITSSLFLGETNAIFSGAIYVATADKTLGALLAFNPNGLTSPAAYFRNNDGVSRVSLWGIGDTSMKTNSNQSASGTNDFTGGTIDATVNTMTIGITETGASSGNTGNGNGTLTFNAGTIDVNNLDQCGAVLAVRWLCFGERHRHRRDQRQGLSHAQGE